MKCKIFPNHGVIWLSLPFYLASCMVGPDFHSPPTPKTTHYVQGKTVTKTTRDSASGSAGKTQYFLLGRDIPGEWWRLFHSEGINTLIVKGIEHSPTMDAARAALVAAQENYRAQIGTLFPTITANFSAQRMRENGSSFSIDNTILAAPRTFNLFNGYLAAAYTLDVFGGLRRQIEAAGAQVDFQRFELEAAFLNLSTSIVNTAISIASLKAQIEATNQLIKAQQKTLNIVRGQFNLGGASKADMLLQETQLASSYASLPSLEQNLAQQYHLLSILIGELPREDKFPQFILSKLSLPTDLPISCPSLLVKQRPDIRASEALLHAASAQIGVATANLFPQITLNANYGGQSNHLDTLFSPSNIVWSISANAAQTLFKGGTLLAQRRAAIANYNQAAAQYKQTVLQAFQNVANSLRALQNDAQLLKTQKKVETTALATLNLTQQSFQLGGSSFLDLLIAQRAYQLALINRIQAQAQRFNDTAVLFQALGGGWWNQSNSTVVSYIEPCLPCRLTK